jgi:RNA polymerase sigma-70 factor, ECF subfamily
VVTSSIKLRDFEIPELLDPLRQTVSRVPAEDAAEPSDPELVERARGGEREAFGFLYRRHQAYVYRFARAMTGSSPLAEDIVQEVFLVLMRDLDRYDPSRAALRTYLFGIARNLSRYKIRTLRRLLPLDHADDAAGSEDPSAALSANDETRHLRRCVRGLPARYREVIVLCDLQELDYTETAVVLNVPIGTVRSRLHRGRQLLIERMRRSDGLLAGKRCLI